MADYIRPTPRNPLLGLIADAMMGGIDWMQDPRRTQQMRGVGGLLSETGIAQTVDRLASGEPLTKGKGFATRMKPETAAAAMTLGPEAVPIGRAAMRAVRATEGLPIGASIRQVAPREEALRLAQQRAALPVSEGGLGLPPNNTPMDRARAMGFTTPAYRGTTANEVTGKARTFASENPDVANQYAGYLSQFSDDPQMLDAMMKLTPNGNVMPLLVKDAAKARARTNVPDYEMILDANQARSRFAAFDPTRRNEPDLLAGALPFTALLDEENRALLEQQFGGLLGR